MKKKFKVIEESRFSREGRIPNDEMKGIIGGTTCTKDKAYMSNTCWITLMTVYTVCGGSPSLTGYKSDEFCGSDVHYGRGTCGAISPLFQSYCPSGKDYKI